MTIHVEELTLVGSNPSWCSHKGRGQSDWLAGGRDVERALFICASFRCPTPGREQHGPGTVRAGNGAPVKIAILGGDGSCSWPAGLYLSAAGRAVLVVDKFSRCAIDAEPVPHRASTGI